MKTFRITFRHSTREEFYGRAISHSAAVVKMVALGHNGFDMREATAAEVELFERTTFAHPAFRESSAVLFGREHFHAF